MKIKKSPKIASALMQRFNQKSKKAYLEDWISNDRDSSYNESHSLSSANADTNTHSYHGKQCSSCPLYLTFLEMQIKLTPFLRRSNLEVKERRS